MSGWTRGDTWAGRACYRREVGGDRIMAYVAFDLTDPELDGGRTQPYTYQWSVQDGSCGRVLEQGSSDGDNGLETARSCRQPRGRADRAHRCAPANDDDPLRI